MLKTKQIIMWSNYFLIIHFFYLLGVGGQDIETVADRIMKKIGEMIYLVAK